MAFSVVLIAIDLVLDTHNYCFTNSHFNICDVIPYFHQWCLKWCISETSESQPSRLMNVL